MIQINISDIPKYFKFCLNDNCPLAGICLRHEAGVAVMESNAKSLSVLNPRLMADKGEDCLEYRTTEIQKCGKGLLKFLNSLSVTESKQVARLLELACSSQRQYYRIRNGEKLVTPEEQEEMQNYLKSHGVDVTITFDEEVNEYDFN